MNGPNVEATDFSSEYEMSLDDKRIYIYISIYEIKRSSFNTWEKSKQKDNK